MNWDAFFGISYIVLIFGGIVLTCWIRERLKKRDDKIAKEAVENFRRDLIIYLSRFRAYKGTPLEDTLVPLNEYYHELSEYVDDIVLWKNRSDRIAMNKIFKLRFDELSDSEKQDIIYFLEELKK